MKGDKMGRKKDSRRKDKDRKILKKGEIYRESDGYYVFRKMIRGKRVTVSAKSLEELREKEEELMIDNHDRIRISAKDTTINDIYYRWCALKKGLRDNTFQNYKYMYDTFVKPDFGNTRLKNLRKSDVRAFYNRLHEERGLKAASIDNVHTVLHQVLDFAVEDDYIRNNPADNVLRDLKKAYDKDSEKRRALALPEQKLFQSFLEREGPYKHWGPIFNVFIGTGMRVGEVTGLTWDCINFKEHTITVKRTLVYYDHGEEGCHYSIHIPKTEAGQRIIPMLSWVEKAFLMEKEYQELAGIKCTAEIDGVTGFVFCNRNGGVYNQSTLNKALRRIIRDCNLELIEKGGKEPVLLPRFSCHNLRHTFTTRMIESNVNLKVIQETLGHKDIKVTLDVYADVTKELRKREFDGLEQKWNEAMESMEDESEETEEDDSES